MARYGAELNKGPTSTTLGVGSVETPGASPRRIALYEFILGSEASPADNNFLFRLTRSSTGSTGTSVTPSPLDPADAAATAVALENLTVEGTNGDELLAIALNQRATFRWVSAPGSEIIIPATANNGIIFQTPTALNTPAATVTALFDER